MDCFNLNDINKSVMELINSLTDISSICELYICEPNKKEGEEIIKIIELSEKNMLKVKRNIVMMVNKIEDLNNGVVNVKNTENGFILE